MTGVLTGNKDFTVKLTTAGSEVSLGGFSSCKVTIIDNDHPLKAIFGEYMATDGDGLSWTMTFAADPNSYTQVFLDGIVPTFSGNYVGQGLRHYVEAPVTVDPVTGKFSVSIPCGYKLPDPFDGHDIMIFGYDGTYIYSSGYQLFEQTEDGFVMEGERGFAAIYENGGYYLAASDAMVMGPITLKKK